MDKTVWQCVHCINFQTMELKQWMNHIRNVHSIHPNFKVHCPVQECPGVFYVYNTLYKHVKKHHDFLYKFNPFSDMGQHVNNEGTRDLQANESDENSDDWSMVSNLSSDEEDTSINNEALDEDQDRRDVPKEVPIRNLVNTTTEGDIERLKKNTALFLLKTREQNKIPQASMDGIMNSVQCLIGDVVSTVRDQINARFLEKPGDSIDDVMGYVVDNFNNPFAGLNTRHLQDSYIKENFRYVDFKEVKLGHEIRRQKKGQKTILVENEETFVYVPIIESLESLLSNDKIRDLILKEPSRCPDKNFYFDICDGSFDKDDPYFKEHPDALRLLLFHDELEVCNPLGTRATKHKLDMYYHIVVNISPLYRSKRCAVRLTAICHSNLIKKYGIDKVLAPIVDDIKALYKGVSIEYNGNTQVIYGKVVACTGDNEGQHQWGGFKEGFGVSFQKCRHCFCDFETMQTNFKESDYILRSKDNFEKHLFEIENAPNDAVKSNLQTCYGITRRSLLCELPGFDITQQLSQDIMHTLLEGSVQYELRHILGRFLKDKHFTLAELNFCITNHPFGYTELDKKFNPLSENVFGGTESYKLKYNASQARLFLRLLPFLLNPFVDEAIPEYSLITQISEIVNLVFAPVISENNITRLEELISLHLQKFHQLFPDVNITPKQHYMVHIPQSIRKMGPLIRYSCFGFESAHNYFKEISRKQNFKNICKSLATRYQFLDCCNFADNSDHPLFKDEKIVGPLKQKPLDDEIRKMLTNNCVLPGIEPPSLLYNSKWVKLFGTKYCLGGIVIIGNIDKLPVFGVIKNIWHVSNYIYFECDEIESLYFSKRFQSYAVQETEKSIFICNEDILDYNVYHKKSADGVCFVPIKYGIEDILELDLIGYNPFLR